MNIKLKPIASVKNVVENRMDANWGEVVSQIRLNPEFYGAFKGLHDFSHVIVLTYLHQATYSKEKHLQRRPRNNENFPLLGIFAQRGKNRPNPIGITAVEVINVDDDNLVVRGLDAINDTPVLDVKPYFPQYDKKDKVKIPGWVNKLMYNYF